MAGSSVASPKPSTSSSSVSKKRKATEDDRFSSFLSSNNNNDNDHDNDDNNDDDVELEEEEEQQIGGSPSSFPKQKPLPAHLLPKHLASTSSSSSSKKAVKQPGLIYLSRIPPGMGPGKVKHLLSQFGEVGRIYLARADANKEVSLKKKFKQKERHQSHNFKEGWIEFLDKRVARSVAEMLNAQNIGGKKSDKWHDDVWTMKYLPKFRWDQLSEQVALERATQTSLMRFHLNHSKQEQESYLSAVEKARVSTKIQEKAASRGKSTKPTAAAGDEAAGGGGGEVKEGKNQRKKREFRQRQAVNGGTTTGGGGGDNEENRGERAGSKKQLDDVLGRLF
ncbi:hypothetical protein JCM5350_006275 [Sporobolomyces pararoseus]